MKNILFVASEAVPFIKTGGLADVVGSLPKYYDKEKFDVRVVLPNYRCIPLQYKEKMSYITHFYMDFAWSDYYVGIMEMEYQGIHFYFIDNEFYFNGFGPYGSIHEDVGKFGFFNKAVLACLPVIGFKPDIIHCHDWQAGLVPVYLREVFGTQDFFKDIKSVMTIHNLKFQGSWEIGAVKYLTMLPDSCFSSDKLELYGDASFLKGGLVYADYITTVSQSYAEEIKMPFYGERLDGLIRARENSLCGIVNGIDYGEFNPETDVKIASRYNYTNFYTEKVKNKTALQKELGFEVNPDKFMIGMVSRLTDQKGFDLIAYMMDELCTEDVQIVVLGTGENRYENMFRHFDWKYNSRMRACIYYSDDMSHKIYASCDAFLMPSLFEPCGLSQLMSLRYGTVPIVRETGGLRDTVWPYNEYESTGTGFSFANYNAHEMLKIVEYAKSVYYNNREAWYGIVKRGMTTDFSWNSSARKYEALYDKMTQ